ncbi:hypothetical protein FVE85_8849 [Porphyridium purpureum]|uniref:Uncharacterized protein n=1 Tax=Porphyridium purpureum TaxID=35688 RepID=A0A5J4YRP7_PORPP|nr:hypothetical protein FVE85_8849 [Porphyridium purpureum]|eukprot:POR0018..scf296_7
MAHAYPAKELGHDVGVDSWESDWMRQREERRLYEMMQSVARVRGGSVDEGGMPPSEQRHETNGVLLPRNEQREQPEMIPAEMDNGMFKPPEEYLHANQQ